MSDEELIEIVAQAIADPEGEPWQEWAREAERVVEALAGRLFPPVVIVEEDELERLDGSVIRRTVSTLADGRQLVTPWREVSP